MSSTEVVRKICLSYLKSKIVTITSILSYTYNQLSGNAIDKYIQDCMLLGASIR